MNTSMITKQTCSDDRTRVKTGFTLVELLVAMAILGMIVLLMGRIFSDSSEAYKTGLKQSDQNLNGRVVLDYVARELRQAIIDENLTLYVKPSTTKPTTKKPVTDPYEMGEGLNDEITFAAIGGKEREVEIIRYYVSKSTKEIGRVDVVSYKLLRQVEAGETEINKAYREGIEGSGAYLTGGAQMVRNVSGFAVRLFDDLNGDGEVECIRNKLDTDTYTATNLPAYADIYLGLMGDSDLVEAHLKGNTNNFIHNREMVFMKRVYFRNRMGYNTGYGRDLYRASED